MTHTEGPVRCDSVTTFIRY